MTGANIWDNPEILDKFEEDRDWKRKREKEGRLTFDCIFAKVVGDKVACGEGLRLVPNSKDGNMQLLSVLRGRTARRCKSCNKFDGDEGEVIVRVTREYEANRGETIEGNTGGC